MTTPEREYIHGLTTERTLEVDYHATARFAATWTVTYDNHPHVAVRDAFDHGQFHLLATFAVESEGVIEHHLSIDGATGAVYGPLHPDMEAEDILGASYARDDGTHWHMAHCSPKEQADFAAQADQFTYEQMQDAINRALVSHAAAADHSTRTAEQAKADALINFAYACGKDAYLRVISASLGHYHRNPHHDHLRDLARTSIRTVLAQWAEQGKTDNDADLNRRRVAPYTVDVLRFLDAEYTIESRAARAKRLKAEAEAAESGG